MQDRFDIPRKFTLIIVGLTALYILLGTFTFHTVGSVALAYSSEGQAGIPKEHILWYGMAIVASLHVWRYLRGRVKPVCDALIVEAGKRRDEAIGQLRKSIDPRLLRAVYGKGRPN